MYEIVHKGDIGDGDDGDTPELEPCPPTRSVNRTEDLPRMGQLSK